MIVGDLFGIAAVRRSYQHAALFNIHTGYPRTHHVRAVETGAKRSTDVRWLETAAGDFCQHRRKQERIAFADDGETDRKVSAELLLQVLGRRHPANPPPRMTIRIFSASAATRRGASGPKTRFTTPTTGCTTKPSRCPRRP